MCWKQVVILSCFSLMLTHGCQCNPGPGQLEPTQSEGNITRQEKNTDTEPASEPKTEPQTEPTRSKEPKTELPQLPEPPPSEPTKRPEPPSPEPTSPEQSDASTTEPPPEPNIEPIPETNPETPPDGSVTIGDSRGTPNKVPFGPHCPVQGQTTLKGHTTTFKTKNAEHQCSGTFTKYEIPPAKGKAELHIVGIYDGGSVSQGQGQPSTPGNVAVKVDRAGTHVLVLAAYEPTNWTVTVGTQTTLQKVILAGYHTQTATVPAGVKVETYTYANKTALTPGYAYQWPSARGSQFVTAIETLTGLPLATFRGCYESTSFTIGAYATVPPGGTVSIPLLAQCSKIIAESGYCLAVFGTSNSKNLGLVGLDTGTLCQYQQSINATVSNDGSIGWVGPYVYGCDRSGVVYEIDIATGSVRFSKRPCSGVTSYQCKILVTPKSFSSRQVQEYDNFARVTDITKNPNKTYPYNGYKRVFAANQSMFWYPTNHSTDTARSIAMGSTNTPVDTKLQGYNDWIHGFDVLNPNLMVIGSPRAMPTGHKPSRDGLILFNKQSGQLLRRLHMRSPKFELLQAIKCFERGK